MAERPSLAYPAEVPTSAANLQHPPAQHPLNIVLALHCPRDEKAAVYKSSVRCANHLKAQGNTCRIVTPDDFPFLRHISARFLPLVYPLVLARWLAKQHGVDLALFHSYAGWAVTSVQMLFRSMRGLRSGIVFHGLEPLYYERLARQAALSGRKLSWRYRLLHGFLMLRLLRLSTRAADVVLCLNREEQRYLIDHHWAKRERVEVVANPVPEHFFVSRLHRDTACVLLFVGQWLPMKGTHYLVEAFTELRREYPDLRLCCAGTLVSAAEVLQSFPADVREHVSVFPRVTENELLALHREADVFVFPSLSEGFSLALAEAMASGLPIVATTVGAAPDLLVHEESALLVPPHAGSPLTCAVARLLQDPLLRNRLARNAQMAATRLRPQVVMRHFEVCFQLLVPERKSGDNGLQQALLVNEGI